MINIVPADVKRVNGWTWKFMNMAREIAKWSKDPSTKVGAVITDRNNIIRGQGYNGFPRGVDDSPVRYANREVKYKMVVHAELNAILNANSNVRGCTIYSTFFPCPQCAAAIIQSGITMVVSESSPSDDRYNDDRDLSKQMFNEAGVTYIHLPPQDAA
jgi:dCMP deaminase